MEKKISLDLAFDFITQHFQILPKEKYILLTLIKLLGNDYSGQVQMSALELSKASGYNYRSVQRHLAKLKIRNLIEIENVYIGSGGYCASNKYRVVGWPQWVESHE